VPGAADMRRSQQAETLYVNNNDGLLDVPMSLIPKKHGRALKMITLTAADKIKAKILMAQARAEKQADV